MKHPPVELEERFGGWAGPWRVNSMHEHGIIWWRPYWRIVNVRTGKTLRCWVSCYLGNDYK